MIVGHSWCVPRVRGSWGTGKAAVCNDERGRDQALVENGSQVRQVYVNKGDAVL